MQTFFFSLFFANVTIHASAHTDFFLIAFVLLKIFLYPAHFSRLVLG